MTYLTTKQFDRAPVAAALSGQCSTKYDPKLQAYVIVVRTQTTSGEWFFENLAAKVEVQSGSEK